MFRKQLAIWIALGAVGLAACGDGAVGPGNASEDDRQELLELLDESGFFADEFNAEGTMEDAAPAGAALAAGAAEDVTPPRVWGRRRLEVLRRTVTVDVDVPNGVAQVSKEIEFEGAFLLDITDDAVINPTSKPLAHVFRQYAVFERREAEVVDAQGRRRRWRLVSISPAELVMPDPAARTVAITEVQIEVNGVPALTVIDPAQTLDVDTEILRLQPGDVITVRAFAENQSVENVPPTFVYLHVFHASPASRRWDRFLMDQVDESGTEWVLSWTARQTGRERIGVDAIDAETFTTETEDDYRANVWGVPYLVEEEVSQE